MSILKSVFIFGISLIVVFFAAAAVLAQGPGDSKQPAFVSGEILVKFKPGVGVQVSRQRLAEVKGTVIRSIPAIGTLQVKVPKGQELAAIEKLRTRPNVEYAEPNYIAYAVDTLPDDTWYSSHQWNLPNISMPAAWDITTGSSSVTIAIVDTGIDLDHPDFSCQVTGGVAKLTAGTGFVDNSDGDDNNGHGSHAAGIAGACTNNGTGVAGVAPNVRLMPVKVLNSGGGGTYAGVAAGITYAVDNGADIINLSLGGTGDSSTLAEAVQSAYNNGVLVVAAAGNFAQSGNPVFYPAAYPEAMAVAATDINDNWANYSEHHPYVEVAAPGGTSTVKIYSTVNNKGYGYKYGTSMATPHVAGLAALIWGMDPDLTHDEVRQIIQSTADDLGDPGKDNFFGYGRINAWQALELFTSIGLQDVSGLSLPDPIVFLADDESDVPFLRTIQVTTPSPDVITWTAVITPAESWISVSPPISGLVSASALAEFTLEVTRPITYDTYTTTIVVTGTTASGLGVGPATNTVRINYLPKLFRYRFPLIFKNGFP